MIYVINRFHVNPYSGVYVDTTSRGDNTDLSPFFLGPVHAYDGTPVCNVENLWQYSKVYPQHVDSAQNPTPEYFAWRNAGFAKQRAVRYPMGKGAKPLYSFYDGHKLDYIQARKIIYAPMYAITVIRTQSYLMLYNAVMAGQTVVLGDFDGYDYVNMGMTLKEVVNNLKKTMGHAFVLAMLLTGTLNECLQ